MTDIHEHSARFPAVFYDTLEEARAAELEILTEMNIPALPLIEDTLTFIFFIVKVDTDKWQDRIIGEIYVTNSADELCPWDGSVKVRLALHLANPQHSVAILCPSVLGETDGQPKTYALLDGTKLADTRPEVVPPLDVLSYVEMSIDDLRARVLSVYFGRVILMIVGLKWPTVAPSKIIMSAPRV